MRYFSKKGGFEGANDAEYVLGESASRNDLLCGSD
jgi:hypothetical protein